MESKHQITVFSAYGQWSYFERLQQALAGQDDMVLLGSAREGTDWVDRAAQASPDVLLMSVEFVQRDPVIPLFRSRSPHTKILIVADHYEQDQEIVAAIEGARGFIAGQIKPETLRKAIRSACAGEIWMRRETISFILSEFIRPGLTPAGSAR